MQSSYIGLRIEGKPDDCNRGFGVLLGYDAGMRDVLDHNYRVSPDPRTAKSTR